MNTRRNREIEAVVQVFLLVFILLGAPVLSLAAQTATDVTVRVENPDSTYITPHTMDLYRYLIDPSTYGFDLNPTLENLTPFHAVIQAMDDMGFDADISSGTSDWICHTNADSVWVDAFGEYPDGSEANGSWFYFVNDKYADVALSKKNLSNYDEVTLFFVDDYKTDQYAYFDTSASDPDGSETVEAVSGETVYLKLMGATLTSNDPYVYPVDSATIKEYDGTAITPSVTTSSYGRFALYLDPGTWGTSGVTISADGNAYDLVRPYCFIDIQSSGVTKSIGTAINEANGLTESTYTAATWSVLSAASSYAVSVNNDPSSTMAEINSATNCLNAAMDDLIEKENVDLYRIGVSEGYELSPLFEADSGDTVYSVGTGGAATIDVWASAYNPLATVSVDGGSSSETVNLTPGTTTEFDIVVTASGVSKTYTLSAMSSTDHTADDVTAFTPAPGQFINEMSGGWGDLYNTDGQKKPLYGPVKDSGISLGAFGGYAIFKFNDPVPNSVENEYGVDFIVYGNAFSGWEEPGGIMVSEGKRQLGKWVPDTWYFIAGSEHYEDATKRDAYSVTYDNPYAITDVPWTDSDSDTGYVYWNMFHNHEYYPGTTNYQGTSDITLSGVSIQLSGARMDVRAPAFGYCDVHPIGTGATDYYVPYNPYQDSVSTWGGDPIDIDWAVDEDGLPVDLPEVRFVKIYTANLEDAGIFGEVSTEITGIKYVEQSGTTVTQTSAPTVEVEGSPVSVPNHLDMGVCTVGDSGVSVTVGGGADNIYVNNQRFAGSGTSTFTVASGTTKQVRFIAQDDDDRPYLFLLSIQNP